MHRGEPPLIPDKATKTQPVSVMVFEERVVPALGTMILPRGRE